MPSLPQAACPVGGLVPWMSAICPIITAAPHPTLGWLYRINEQREGAALVCWCNITQQEVVAAMNAHAQFKVGQAVHIGAFSPRHIRGRKWDFRRGCFLYIIEGNREGREEWMDEEGLGKLQAGAKQNASPR